MTDRQLGVADVLDRLRCPHGDEVTARLCRVGKLDQTGVDALRSVLVATHCQLAGHDAESDAPASTGLRPMPGARRVLAERGVDVSSPDDHGIVRRLP